VLAVVPARGGSKGVPLKNIHPLGGRPLIAHAADAIRQAGIFDRAIVSTDHPLIAETAKAWGLSVPFARPDHLSGDRVGDWEVLEHALRAIEQLDERRYDVLVMLQPTSPLRRGADVRGVVECLVDDGWEAVWTVSPTPLKYHPLKQLRRQADGRIQLWDDRGRQVVARQQLEPVYHRNGAAYALSRRAILELGTILPERSTALVLDVPAVSIDTLDDFAEVERLMARRALEGD